MAINPSCEHFTMQHLCEYVGSYNPGTRFLLSSTNMPAEDHVHCSESVEDFATSVAFAGVHVHGGYALDLQCNGWKRFYVTGVL